MSNVTIVTSTDPSVDSNFPKVTGTTIDVDTHALDVNIAGGTIDVGDITIGSVTIDNGAGTAAVNIQDGGNSITVDDGGVSLTVDGTVDIGNFPATQTVDGTVELGAVTLAALEDITVTASNLDIRDLSAATDSVTIHGSEGVVDQFDLTNSNPAAVAIVDANGDQITSFGGGTQYTEGDTDASIMGTASLAEGPADTLEVLQVDIDKNLKTIISDVQQTGTLANASEEIIIPIEDRSAATAMFTGVFDGLIGISASTNGVDFTGFPGILSSILVTSITGDNAGQLLIFNVGGLTHLKFTATTWVTGTATLDINLSAATSLLQFTYAINQDLDIRNLDFATDSVDVSGSTLGANSGVDIGDVTVNNGSGASAVNIQDGGNSITVDGTVAATQSGTWTVTGAGGTFPVTDSGGSLTVDAVNLDIRDLVFATDKVDASGTTLGANSGVDIGDVTINNASGGAAVNIQDGGNTITVDGSVSISGAVDTELTTADLDTGAGTDTRAVVGLVGSASGGGQLIPGSSTDGLLVNLGANNDVTVTGTVTANAGTNLNTSLLALEAGGNLAAAAASLSVLDDWDETNRAAVNIIAGQVGVQGASGTVNALTQRVVLATDVALPAGANSIGTLGANSGVDIGDVTINNAAGASAVNIQDGGNTITVDGTIAATQSGTWNIATLTSITNAVTVAGAAADGAAVSGNPVRVAGKDGSGNTQDMITHTDGRLWPHTGFTSTSNSRANASLAGAATFTGTFEDITQYAGFSVGILDAGANGGTLTINWSEDGVNVRDTDVTTVPTANGQQFTFGRKWQFFQVSYLHGAGTGNVVIQTILCTVSIVPSTHFGSESITTGQDGQLVIAELRALSGSSFVNVLCDSAGNLLTTNRKPTTATHSNVNDTASTTTLLASNSARLGASVYNDSTVILYLKLGATASTTSFTTKLFPEAYYEVPFGYTGVIDGIWASDASGAARIVEHT